MGQLIKLVSKLVLARTIESMQAEVWQTEGEKLEVDWAVFETALWWVKGS